MKVKNVSDKRLWVGTGLDGWLEPGETGECDGVWAESYLAKGWAEPVKRGRKRKKEADDGDQAPDFV